MPLPPTPLTWLFRLALVITLVALGYLAFSDIQHQGIAAISDKLNHVAAFLVLSVLADFAFPKRSFDSQTMLAVLGYGVFIECVQGVLPYREASLADLLADSLGIMAYRLLYPLLLKHPWCHYRFVEGQPEPNRAGDSTE